MIFFYQKKKTEGQSLIELILAIALGVIFIGVAAMVIAPILKINTETNEAKVGGAWARELLENTRLWVENDWHNLDGLARQEYYYLSTSTDIFVLSDGIESVDFGTTTYRRFFYIQDICRDSNNVFSFTGEAPCDNPYVTDPSVVKVNLRYSWSPEYATKTFSALVTRFRNKITVQTDWSTGGGVNGTTTLTAGYATSSVIDATSTPGSIVIEGF